MIKIDIYGAEIKVSSPETLEGRLESWKKTWSNVSQSRQKCYDSVTIGEEGSKDLRENWPESPKIMCHDKWSEIGEVLNKVPSLLSWSRVHDDTAVREIFFVVHCPFCSQNFPPLG